jgi:hypothetical protein
MVEVRVGGVVVWLATKIRSEDSPRSKIILIRSQEKKCIQRRGVIAFLEVHNNVVL